jgi:hypothetical protein
LFPNRHPFVNNLNAVGGDLKVGINEALTAAGTHAIAFIGPDQTLRAVSFADSYWRAHEELQEAGTIDHGRDACPERGSARIVREWTPAGWRDFQAEPEWAAER